MLPSRFRNECFWEGVGFADDEDILRLLSELLTLPDDARFIFGDKLANNEFSLAWGPGELAVKFKDGFDPLKWLELLLNDAANDAKPLDDSFDQSVICVFTISLCNNEWVNTASKFESEKLID